jgi:transcriptional regulator with XRE-family HTH domain
VSSIQTQTPFREALAQLLKERKTSLRELGRRLGVDPTHLSRVRQGKKRLPDNLPERVAMALGLPRDYFPETREHIIIQTMRTRPDLREQIYRTICNELSPEPEKAPSPRL